MTHAKQSQQLIHWLLLESGATVYRIWKDTKVAQMTMTRIIKGDSEIGNLPLKTAQTLENYARKLKEEMKMEKLQLEGLNKAIEEFNEWPKAAAIYWNRKNGYADVDVYNNDVEATQTTFTEGIIVLYRKNERAGENKNIGTKRKEFLLDYAELIADGYDGLQAEYQLMDKYPASYFG